MPKDKTPVTPPNSSTNAVSEFLQAAARTPVKVKGAEPGRLIFALDATASREPTWDTACQIQAQMFSETSTLGGLQIQLCYYHGFQRFRSAPWCSDTTQLKTQMAQVRCLGGHTQIGRVLQHALRSAKKTPIQALIFIGDALEEPADPLCDLAGQLGLSNVPVFIFQEGHNPAVTRVFEYMARVSGGACVPFDHHSASQLRDLLAAVAVYAAGGRKALEHYGKVKGGQVALLTQQLKGR
jgi:hypothetical protein